MATWLAFLGIWFELGVDAWSSWVNEHIAFLGLAALTVVAVPRPAASRLRAAPARRREQDGRALPV